ncbi:sugar transporter [Pedobacter sp. HMWF019]|uniref:protein-disulfide reductase DsbD domain-containing protein n=1 Tax=Pedobacter sp. HMWF019 TaxID=2056856 RepID=UPI000D340778|nr:protein-disulfide reductase DsbD domain-containing protein [Pedobacter sp. HMWF019]PTS92630.1 sugar transporter [Pedobacter sp. HMWF019]
MKRITLILSFLVLSVFAASAQIENPVKWSYGQKKISKTEAIVFVKANIEDGWHIYSQNVKDGGPVKTTITFAPSKDYVKVGTTSEPKPVTKFEKSFDMNVSYFEKQVIFQQKVKLNKPSATVKGKVEFMVCNDSKCLPPTEVEFSVQVK